MTWEFMMKRGSAVSEMKKWGQKCWKCCTIKSCLREEERACCLSLSKLSLWLKKKNSMWNLITCSDCIRLRRVQGFRDVAFELPLSLIYNCCHLCIFFFPQYLILAPKKKIKGTVAVETNLLIWDKRVLVRNVHGFIPPPFHSDNWNQPLPQV